MNLTVSFFVGEHLREMKQVTTPCTIGRSSRANWVLTHPMLSRSHCILYDKNEELYLCDDGSLNGTYYKGIPVKEPVRLQCGDEFAVGRGHNLKFCVSILAAKNPETKRMDYAHQTTTIDSQNDLDSGQSTILTSHSAAQE